MEDIKNSTIVASLTVGQLRELICEFLSNENHFAETEKKNYVYGLRGIMSLLNCSHTIAQRYKDSILKEAVMQNGRKIVVDADKAIELFKKSGKCLWLFSRRKPQPAIRHNFLLLAVSQLEEVSDPEPIPPFPSLPSLTSVTSQDLPIDEMSIEDMPDFSQYDSEGNDGSEGCEGNEGHDRLYMPTFYEKVQRKLPSFLKQITKVSDSDADADLLILGSIAAISACLPGIYGIYDQRMVFPNLFLFVTARAGSGKGRLNLCKALVDPIHEELEATYKKALEQFLDDLNQKEGDEKQNKKTETDRPTLHLIFLPANSSSTAIYSALRENDEQGLIFETEGDTLAASFGQDFGDFSDGLRKAFHHEPITYLRRGDSEYVNIKRPRLSAVLSGTPQQVVRLMTSVENGLFSRFLFYYLDKKIEWHDVIGSGESEPLEEYFNKLGRHFQAFYHNLNNHADIRIKLTAKQGKSFNKNFTRLLDDFFAFFGEKTTASVFRLGLSTFRIAMILSAMRIMEDKDYTSPRYCRDEDFEIAMAISKVLQRHILRAIEELPESKNKTSKNNAMDTLRCQTYWEELPEMFDAKDFKIIGNKVGVPESTAERYISTWFKSNRLVRIERGKYKKR